MNCAAAADRWPAWGCDGYAPRHGRRTAREPPPPLVPGPPLDHGRAHARRRVDDALRALRARRADRRVARNDRDYGTAGGRRPARLRGPRARPSRPRYAPGRQRRRAAPHGPLAAEVRRSRSAGRLQGTRNRRAVSAAGRVSGRCPQQRYRDQGGHRKHPGRPRSRRGDIHHALRRDRRRRQAPLAGRRPAGTRRLARGARWSARPPARGISATATLSSQPDVAPRQPRLRPVLRSAPGPTAAAGRNRPPTAGDGAPGPRPADRGVARYPGHAPSRPAGRGGGRRLGPEPADYGGLFGGRLRGDAATARRAGAAGRSRGDDQPGPGGPAAVPAPCADDRAGSARFRRLCHPCMHRAAGQAAGALRACGRSDG